MATITIDRPSGGDISWATEEIEGLDVIYLMTAVLFDMHEYFLKSEIRPILTSITGRVCIEVKDDNLAVAYRPEAETKLAIGMISAALVGLLSAVKDPDFNPMVAFLGAIHIPIEVNRGDYNGTTDLG